MLHISIHPIFLFIIELGKHRWIYSILRWIRLISHYFLSHLIISHNEHCPCCLAWACSSNCSLKLLQASNGEAGSEIGSNLIRGAMEELSLLSACTAWRTGKWCRVHLANMHPVKKWPPRDVGALQHVKCPLFCVLSSVLSSVFSCVLSGVFFSVLSSFSLVFPLVFSLVFSLVISLV